VLEKPYSGTFNKEAAEFLKSKTDVTASVIAHDPSIFKMPRFVSGLKVSLTSDGMQR